MYYTDDPVRDAERHDADADAAMERLPKCSECGHSITDDMAFYINDEWICDECMYNYHRRDVEDI